MSEPPTNEWLRERESEYRQHSRVLALVAEVRRLRMELCAGDAARTEAKIAESQARARECLREVGAAADGATPIKDWIDWLIERYLAACQEIDCRLTQAARAGTRCQDVRGDCAACCRARLEAEREALQRALASKIAPGEGEVKRTIERLTYSLAAANARADRLAAALAQIESLGVHVGGCREVAPECDCGVCPDRHGDSPQVAVACPARRHFSHGEDCAVANAHARGLLRMVCDPDCPTATAKRAREET